MAKAKWLENSTNKELIQLVSEALLSGDEKEIKKAIKAAEELEERTPDSDGQVSMEEALTNLKEATAVVAEAYKAEMEALEDGTEEDVEVEDEEDDVEDLSSLTKKELITKAKEMGLKVNKKMSPEDIIELIEDVEEDEDEDEAEDVDYSELSKKELIALAKERGLKVNRKMGSDEMIEILEADDNE